MADEPSVTPPQPVQPPAPTPTPSGPPVEDLSNLSPFKVLQHRQQGNQVSESPSVAVPPAPLQAEPASLQSVPTPLSREELLKQAAETPATSFILPPQEALNQPQPAVAPPPIPPVAPVPPPAPVAPRPLPTPPATPPQPVQPPVSQPVRPPIPASIKIPPPLEVKPVSRPAAVPVPPPAGLGASSPIRLQTPQKSGGKGLLIGAVIAGLLLVTGGVLYVMAARGSRVPFFYTQVTGLPTTGEATAQQALAFVQARHHYQLVGTSSLTPASSSSTSTPQVPNLPDGSDTSAPAGAVYSAKATISAGEFSEGGSKFLGKEDITINDSPALSAVLRTGAAMTAPAVGTVPRDGMGWVSYVPSGVNPEVIEVPADTVRQTFLYSVLQPVPLEAILKGIGTETAYLPETNSQGNKQAAYAYDAKAEVLAGYFPATATLESMNIVVRYSQKSTTLAAGVPLEARLKGVMVYKQKKYDFDFFYSYSGWDQALSTTTDTNLASVATPTAAVARGAAEFVRHLGILSLEALPTTLSEELQQEVDTAVNPTGEGVTVAGDPIASSPSVAPTPSAEGIARDTQRLKDLQDLKTALENYKKDVGSYPSVFGTEQTGASATLINALVPKYITKVPIDPTKITYWYGYTSDGSTFIIRSVAEDTANSAAKRGGTFYYFEVINSEVL